MKSIFILTRMGSEMYNFSEIDFRMRYDIPCHSEWVKESNFTLFGGYQAAQEILSSYPPPQAIFAANDLLAIGAMKVVKEKGWSTPHDIAIAGFDGIFISELVDPPLTTIVQPTYEMGMRAVEILIKAIRNKKMTMERVVLPAFLRVRASTDPRLLFSYKPS